MAEPVRDLHAACYPKGIVITQPRVDLIAKLAYAVSQDRIDFSLSEKWSVVYDSRVNLMFMKLSMHAATCNSTQPHHT
jgi:hypothetical protein